MNVATVSKAIAGAIVTALVALLAQHGVIISPDVNDALNVLLAALIGFIGVYIAPKNRGTK
jgi:hypothetical protein